jgi:hypothetical protein
MMLIDVFGALVITCILVASAAGMVFFMLADGIPLVIRAVSGLFFLLFLAVMIYVIRDRMLDIRKERMKKGGE